MRPTNKSNLQTSIVRPDIHGVEISAYSINKESGSIRVGYFELGPDGERLQESPLVFLMRDEDSANIESMIGQGFETALMSALADSRNT